MIDIEEKIRIASEGRIREPLDRDLRALLRQYVGEESDDFYTTVFDGTRNRLRVSGLIVELVESVVKHQAPLNAERTALALIELVAKQGVPDASA